MQHKKGWIGNVCMNAEVTMELSQLHRNVPEVIAKRLGVVMWTWMKQLSTCFSAASLAWHLMGDLSYSLTGKYNLTHCSYVFCFFLLCLNRLAVWKVSKCLFLKAKQLLARILQTSKTNNDKSKQPGEKEQPAVNCRTCCEGHSFVHRTYFLVCFCGLFSLVGFYFELVVTQLQKESHLVNPW